MMLVPNVRPQDAAIQRFLKEVCWNLRAWNRRMMGSMVASQNEQWIRSGSMVDPYWINGSIVDQYKIIMNHTHSIWRDMMKERPGKTMGKSERGSSHPSFASNVPRQVETCTFQMRTPRSESFCQCIPHHASQAGWRVLWGFSSSRKFLQAGSKSRTHLEGWLTSMDLNGSFIFPQVLPCFPRRARFPTPCAFGGVVEGYGYCMILMEEVPCHFCMHQYALMLCVFVQSFPFLHMRCFFFRSQTCDLILAVLDVC